MLRILLVLIVFALPSQVEAQAVYKGRTYNAPVCNSPNCAMCNYIRAQLQAPVISTAHTATEYETIQVPYQVKHCNGRTCWYETRYRTERRPIRKTIKAALDMLRITDLAPTPREAVTAMLELANPQSNEVLYDLGCGDGRVLVAAVSGYGCRAVGVELNPESFQLATNLVTGFNLTDKVRLYEGDVLNYTYEQADIVTMYLYPELIEKILPKLRKGTRIISYLHPLPGGNKVVSKGYVFYTLTVQ